MSNVTKAQIFLAASFISKDAAKEPCLNWVKTRQELVDTLQEMLEGSYMYVAMERGQRASTLARDMVSDAIGMIKHGMVK